MCSVDLELGKKVVLVTGGGTGLGSLIARKLGELGARVVIADQAQPAADQTRRHITFAGGQALAVRADTSQSHHVARMMVQAYDWAGRLDVLINCVIAPSRSLPLARSRASEIDRVLAVNVRGPFLCTKAFLNALLEKGCGGRIVSVVSSAAWEPRANLSVFAASQAAVLALMQSAAAEVAEHEIFINALCTRVAGASQDQNARQVLEVVDTLLEPQRDWRSGLQDGGATLGSMETPEAVIAALAFLASDRAGTVTGLTFGSAPRNKLHMSTAVQTSRP